MKTKPLEIKWQGTFIELCMHRVTQAEKARIEAALSDAENKLHSAWYENVFLLRSLFNADNWWSIDDLDHSMGLVFTDRTILDNRLSTICYTLAGAPVTVDPDALQLSFYAPEIIDNPLAATDQILCHGSLRQAEMRLDVDVEPPFDPSLLTLSFLTYPGYGSILIDMDYEGQDEVRFTWGDQSYLKPQFVGKDHFNDIAE